MSDGSGNKGFFTTLRENPATHELLDNLGKFAGAQAGSLASRAVGGGKTGGAAEGAVEAVTEKQAEGEKAGPLTAIKGAIKGFFGKGGGAKRPTNIYEQIFIGVPVETAYGQWKLYSEFPKFMKGPESVTEEQGDGDGDPEAEGSVGTKTKWTAKIFLNRRSWTATVEEDHENYKIRWSSEAPKGTIDGTVTFAAVGENMTLMVYVLEYRPKGFFEWWGNRWRTVGRRARLDVKHYGRYVMMQDLEEGLSQAQEGLSEDQGQDDDTDENEEVTDEPERELDEDRGEGAEPEPAEPSEPEESREPSKPEEPEDGGESDERKQRGQSSQPSERRRDAREERRPREARRPREER